jgi:hypothetical protein
MDSSAVCGESERFKYFFYGDLITVEFHTDKNARWVTYSQLAHLTCEVSASSVS